MSSPYPKNGMVWLVGAGPGDPGLITVKGTECIRKADVIVFDALCNPAFLAGARADCEILYAGKQAGKHSMKQEDINALLAEKAGEGKRVCRLKGGDPFVFGRGGEEALFLRERGIDFEIVPGVTSAIAVPAYAGIPVTHRAVATSFRVITGHEDPLKPESQLDWKELAATKGTLVFLMGVHNLAAIAERLVEGGKSAQTPAALIANGTGPAQRTALGTLATIAAVAEAEQINPPAILVVGEVVSLRSQLQWYERLSLFGRSIVVTRTRAQNSGLLAALRAMGAEAIEAPVIRTESLCHSDAMRQAAREANTFNWLLFTSVNGVDAFFEAMDLEGLDARALAGVKVGVIGPGTAQRLACAGVRADLMPERFVAEALLDALEKTEPLRGQRYLVPRADIARPDLVDGLRARGAEVREVAAYNTVAEPLPEALADRIERGEIDLVTFTSSSTVTNFVQGLPEGRRESLVKNIRAASIGPVTSATLELSGIEIVTNAAESTIASLADAIAAYFKQDKE